MKRYILLALGFTPASLTCQLPPDHMLIGTFQVAGEPTLGGLYLVTPSGSSTILSGYLSVPEVLTMDPYDGTFWNSPAMVRFALTGSAVTNAVWFATLPRVAIGGLLEFDVDGHALVCTRDFNAIPLLYRVHRETGQVTTLQDGTIRILQGMDMDPTTWRLYLIANPIGPYPNRDVFYLDPPYTGQPVLVGSIGSVVPPDSVLGSVNVATFLPVPQLYLSFGRGHVARMDPATGGLTVLNQYVGHSIFGGLGALLRHDRNQSFYTVFGGGGGGGVGLVDVVVRMDQNGSFQTTTNLGLFGSPGLHAINGFVPGSLYIAPMNVSASGFLLEAGVWGQPGELALLAITQPFVALVAAGVTNSAGVLPVKLRVPPGTVAPGNPHAIEFVAATVNLSTLAVTLSQPKRWPAN